MDTDRLFISHAVSDGAELAHDLVARLEAAGRHCWIAPRDVGPGRTYPAQIMSAIRSASGMVLLLSSAANDSPDVLQEVQIAHSERKLIVPVVIDGVVPSDDFGYFLAVRHRIAWTSPQDVTAAILSALPGTVAAPGPSDGHGNDDTIFDPVEAIAAAAAADSGMTGRFRLTVRSTAVEDAIIWLNSEQDYRDPRCLALALARPVWETLMARHGSDVLDRLVGQTLLVDGVAVKRRIDFLSNGQATGHYYFQTHVEVDNIDHVQLPPGWR